MEGGLGMHSLTKELADIFEEESENDRTFYGFSDSEKSDCSKGSDSEGGFEAKLDPSSKHKDTSSKQPAHPFRLRIALRSRSSIHHSTEEEEEEAEERTKERELKKDAKSKRKTLIKKERHVKFEEEEKPVAQPFLSIKSGSGSDDDEYSSFLDKRAQNIKANKAMLAQLMADLQKMPGGGGLLKKQAAKKPKERGPRPPRSSTTGGESRKNPERATRRRTRSMGGGEDSPALKEREVELSLEEELLEVRGAPRRRGTPRPNQSKPHIIRPPEEITEDEIQLVADNMTDKVYNRVTGSTCHQCRQKTTDTKTCCRSEDCRGILGQFCGPCLRNRYGEDVKKALLDPDWRCPPCRGICNCSFCRQREGRCPTGILFPLAQYHGFSDVHSYLSSLRNKLKNEEEDEDL